MTGHSVFGVVRIAFTRAISLLKSIRSSRSRLPHPFFSGSGGILGRKPPGRSGLHFAGCLRTASRERVGMSPAGKLAGLYPESAHVASEPRGGEDHSRQRREPLRGDACRSAAVVPDAGHVAVELASEGL